MKEKLWPRTWSQVGSQVLGSFFVFVSIFLTFFVRAGDDFKLEPLSFKAWKEQQTIEAQNQLARVSNQILWKKGVISQSAEEITPFASESDPTGFQSEGRAVKIQKLPSQALLAKLEKEQARCQKSVEFAKELGVQEYVLGYLSQFQGHTTALISAAGRLSKEEIAELLRVLIRSGSQNLGQIQDDVKDMKLDVKDMKEVKKVKDSEGRQSQVHSRVEPDPRKSPHIF